MAGAGWPPSLLAVAASIATASIATLSIAIQHYILARLLSLLHYPTILP